MASNNKVFEALKKCTLQSDEIINADLDIFCPEAQSDKASAFKQVIFSFGNE